MSNIIDEAMEREQSLECRECPEPAESCLATHPCEHTIRAAIEHAVRLTIYEAQGAMGCTQDREGRPLMHIDQIKYVTDRMCKAAGIEVIA